LAVLAATALGASAAEPAVHVGGATINFDPAHYRGLSLSAVAAYFAPQKEAAHDLGPVDVRVYSGAESLSCAELAQQTFAAHSYDDTAIEQSAASIGGFPAERFGAHTRCRNATPRGEIACVVARGQTYVFSALQAGCAGRNPFSGVDPLAEIIGGVTFAP
jgi:hypothetical protein